MKNALLLAAILFAKNLAAQTDCDGQRYVADVFSTVKKTTVTFGTNNNSAGIPTTLKMDVYEPTGDTWAARPVIVLAHGGSFITGARTDLSDLCTLFAKKGYVAATIDYRLWPWLIQGLPDSLDIMDVVVKAVGDMRAAVRYFRLDAAGANKFKIDPARILVGGYSAGAVAAMHVAQMSKDDALSAFIQSTIDANGGWEGTTGSADNLAQSSDVRAVVSLSGGLYKKEWITATDKPFISFHGVKDDVVYYNFGIAAGIMSLNGSGNLHPVANSVGLLNYLRTVPTGDHMNIHFDAAYQADRDTFYSVGCQFLLDNVLCTPVAIDSVIPDATRLTAMPNPSSDEMEIKLPEAGKSWSVTVFDVTGRQVFGARDVRNSLTVNKKDLGGMAGMYFVLAKSSGSMPLVVRAVFE